MYNSDVFHCSSTFSEYSRKVSLWKNVSENPFQKQQHLTSYKKLKKKALSIVAIFLTVKEIFNSAHQNRTCIYQVFCYSNQP